MPAVVGRYRARVRDTRISIPIVEQTKLRGLQKQAAAVMRPGIHLED
jgi:hypothetical protein